MAQYRMHINPLSFNLIQQGKKTLEVRLKKDGVENYAAGDTLEIVNRETGETLTRRITAINEYASVDELVDREDIRKSGNFENKEPFVERLRSFQTEDEEKQFGLAAIHLG
jgi:ASC-1-like (ASCH) protein